jgi:N-acetylated-alpha-linked acidic dipeptidase
MTPTEAAFLNAVTMDEPWALIESFATFKREHPTDVNRGMDEVVARLTRHGVPVTVHEPSLYLSLPGVARVQAGGVTMRAKPPAYSVDARGGVTGKLVYIGANAIDDIDDMFDRRFDSSGAAAARAKGNIVISDGFASPVMVQQFMEMGAIGVIAINPGIDIHWGICTTIWGVPDLDDLPRKPTIPVCAVNQPDGKALREIAKAGGEVTIFTEMEEGWFASKLPEVFIPGTEEPEKYVLLHGHLDSWDVGVGDNAVGDAAMLEMARVLWANRDKLKRSVRICWWPGHSTGRYAGSTWFSDRFAIDLEENCVAQVNCDSPGCRWATEFNNLSRMTETDALISGVISEVAGKVAHGERPHRAGDYSFNNIGISSYFMLSSTMSDSLREEKGYYGSAVAVRTSPGTPKTTPWKSPTRRSCSGTSRSICWRSCARQIRTCCRLTGARRRGSSLAPSRGIRPRPGGGSTLGHRRPLPKTCWRRWRRFTPGWRPGPFLRPRPIRSFRIWRGSLCRSTSAARRGSGMTRR